MKLCGLLEGGTFVPHFFTQKSVLATKNHTEGILILLPQYIQKTRLRGSLRSSPSPLTWKKSFLATWFLATFFHTLRMHVSSHKIALETSFLHRKNIWWKNHGQIFYFFVSHIFSHWNCYLKKICQKIKICQTCLTAILNATWQVPIQAIYVITLPFDFSQ